MTDTEWDQLIDNTMLICHPTNECWQSCMDDAFTMGESLELRHA